jgi:hypothetical protein
MTLVWRPGYGGAAVSDPDAQTYLQAVEVADNQALEQGVQQAVNQFVIGCKADGIWNAIKASCILAGARTLTGALVPLVGTAPTNFNFVSGDYNRETGLVGNGSTKYLSSNRNSNTDPQNSNHNAVYTSFVGTYDTTVRGYIGDTGDLATPGANVILQSSSVGLFSRNRSSAGTATNIAPSIGLIAVSRSSSVSYTLRNNKSNIAVITASEQPANSTVLIFRRGVALSPEYTNARLAFYSIGESLDLALLDARVTTLINAFAAAIP